MIRTFYCTLLRPCIQAWLLRKKWSCRLMTILKNNEASSHSFLLHHTGPELQTYFEMKTLRLQHRYSFQIPVKRVFWSHRLSKLTHQMWNTQLASSSLSPECVCYTCVALHCSLSPCLPGIGPTIICMRRIGLESGRELWSSYAAGWVVPQGGHDQERPHFPAQICGPSSSNRSDPLFHNVVSSFTWQKKPEMFDWGWVAIFSLRHLILLKSLRLLQQ